jgi:hypothetical protein
MVLSLFSLVNVIWMPDGGKNPTFDEKFHISLIEGLRELTVNVWNSNTLRHDDFIGSGRLVVLPFFHVANGSIV